MKASNRSQSFEAFSEALQPFVGDFFATIKMKKNMFQEDGYLPIEIQMKFLQRSEVLQVFAETMNSFISNFWTTFKKSVILCLIKFFTLKNLNTDLRHLITPPQHLQTIQGHNHGNADIYERIKNSP